VNGDGKLDLLVGDSVTLVAPTKGVSAEEFKRRLAAWRQALEAAEKEADSATADSSQRKKAHEVYSKIFGQRTEFMKEDHTGFVWFYLQK
jgi:hypothetical protein